MTTPLLSVRDLSVTFAAQDGGTPVRAVDGISFDIKPGETLRLVRQSGSSKTTTGRAVLQLKPMQARSVELLRQDLTQMRKHALRRIRQHMQFMLQNPYSSLHPRMTVEQILRKPLIMHRTMPPAQERARVAELLDLVRLNSSIMRHYPHKFSGGQRQRIIIARALTMNPNFIMCNEPVSALDVRTQAQIVTLLHDLQEKLKMSYLFITHNLAIVREITHRVAMMYSSKIVKISKTTQIYRAPQHAYTRILLDAVAVPDPAAQRARLRRAPSEAQWPPTGT